jgi:hypothetical protein
MCADQKKPTNSTTPKRLCNKVALFLFSVRREERLQAAISGPVDQKRRWKRAIQHSYKAGEAPPMPVCACSMSIRGADYDFHVSFKHDKSNI